MAALEYKNRTKAFSGRTGRAGRMWFWGCGQARILRAVCEFGMRASPHFTCHVCEFGDPGKNAFYVSCLLVWGCGQERILRSVVLVQ